MGGIGTYLDLACRSGTLTCIERHVKIRRGRKGWTDAEHVLSLVMLNLVGGDCVEDLNRLESDEGFCRLLSKALKHGLSRKGWRGLKKRWRKEKPWSVPSSSSIFRYLAAFQYKSQDRLREPGKAFIPEPNEGLKSLCMVNKELVGFVQNNHVEQTATLDMGVVLHTEFRDGNVPAGFEQKRVLEEALGCLHEGVKKVRMRSDTAGYQHELLKYCDKEDNKGCGRIEFTVGCDVTPEFKKAVEEVAAEDWTVLMKREPPG